MAEQARSCFMCGDKTSAMYHLPKDEDLKKKWLEFIFGSLPTSYPKSLVVCAKHFQDSDFANLGAYTSGFASKLVIKPGSSPSVRSATTSQAGTSQQDPGVHDFPSIPGFHDIGCQTDPPKTASVSMQAAISPIMDAGNRFCLIMPAAPTPPRKRSVGTQLSMKTLQNHFRSTATQTRVPSKDCGVCTLTLPLDSPLLFLQPTIVKRPRLSLTDEEEGPSECSVSVAVNEPEDST